MVWGDRKGPLTSAQVARYRERGYLMLPNLFEPEEVAFLVDGGDQLREKADPSRDDVITAPGSKAIRSLFRVHRQRPFSRSVSDRRIAGAARQLLGSEVYILQSRINYKPAFQGRPFPWHSDFETWHMEDGMPRPRALSVSLLLTDNTNENGPLMVIPGSHRSYVRCSGETPPNHYASSLVNQEYGVPSEDVLTELVSEGGIESATGPAGTVVFFDCNLMHGSGVNLTPMPRNNLFVVYNSVDNQLQSPFGSRPPRPSFVAEREVIPLP